MGVGFPERNDSFDFLGALDDFRKQMRLAKGLSNEPVSKGPSKDFSLKEGEKISINIPGMSNASS